MRCSAVLPISMMAALLLPVSPIHPQGITTSGIRGVVRAFDGGALDGPRVLLVNAATGFSLRATVRRGSFLLQGLEPGGPYMITVQHAGLRPQQRGPVYLELGQTLELHFLLQPEVFELDTVAVLVKPRSHAHAGIATTLGDSLLQSLPTLNRDLYDFVRLVPQISTTIGFQPGISGGGVGFRFNNFLINGVTERTVFANATNALSGGKSLPLEAVKEYQVLLTPYDVRYADFAGALVNTVTKAGTNQMHGNAFAYVRNDELARSRTSPTPYEKLQYGFTVGGLLRRDKAHFFLASEFQAMTSPAEGAYLAAESGNARAPIDAADVTRLQELMRGYGLTAGSAGPIENANPMANVFARIDVALPWQSRAVFWANYAQNSESRFARTASDSFPLSTYQFQSGSRTVMAALHLHTTLSRADGGHNELLVSYDVRRSRIAADVKQPVIRVQVPGTGGGLVTVNTGTNPQAQDIFIRPLTLNMANHLTLPLGTAHVLTTGIALERFEISRGGAAGSYGTWTFTSLDAFERGAAAAYELRRDFSSTSAINGAQYAAYIGDQWRVSDHITFTTGVRGDMLKIQERAPYNATIDSLFGRRTDVMPGGSLHLSPRAGVIWDVFGLGRDVIRAGAGVFTGRPPVAWLQTALSSYGVGIGRLRCVLGAIPGGPSPPPFEPDYRNAPESCANGLTIRASPLGDVDLLDPNLRMAQTLRASFAYDRKLPWDVTASAELLVTRNISDFIFANLNLVGPQSTGYNGRVLYGTIDSTGAARAALRSNFAEVIDLRNTSRNHSRQLSARLEKRFARGSALTAAYTHTRAWDVQTPLRTGVPGVTNWSSRAVSERHEDMSLSTSLNDIPHRVVFAGTHRVGNQRWATQLSFYYIGEPGNRFTYRSFGVGGRGDLNADGSNLNDPIYVPRSAFDSLEIRFVGTDTERAEQQSALEELIATRPCLRHQRGRILARNSCAEPWFHTSVAAVRQSVPVGARPVDVHLEIYNFLNLLNRDWGHQRIARQQLLEHVAQQPAAGIPSGQPVYRLNRLAAEWDRARTASAYQLQLAVRYNF